MIFCFLSLFFGYFREEKACHRDVSPGGRLFFLEKKIIW